MRKRSDRENFGCRTDSVNKENSLVADFEMIPQTIECALGGRQIQPLLLQR